MTNQAPLNPDALEAAAKAKYGEDRNASASPDVWPDWEDKSNEARDMYREEIAEPVAAYFAVAQPVVNSVEELDALPVGAVVLSEGYIARQEGEKYPCVFQKLYTGDWHRGGRSSDTPPDYFLPARILYRPAVPGA